MRHRALKDVLQLEDQEFLSAVADGLEALWENAEQFYIDSERIAKYKRSPGFGVLRGIAEEEAAKCLILIDAVRCPLRDHTQQSRQLGYFYEHLACGIYAEVAAGQPETFGELRALVDELRQTLFLDGPDGYNYIYTMTRADRSYWAGLFLWRFKSYATFAVLA